jgi:hypothetical protein
VIPKLISQNIIGFPNPNSNLSGASQLGLSKTSTPTSKTLVKNIESKTSTFTSNGVNTITHEARTN